MIFWDSSAVVPLLLIEGSRETLLDVLKRDPDMIVWWGTSVECTSAIARREREGDLGRNEAAGALDRLGALGDGWHEVLPSEAVRRTAQRMLRVHPLRAADSLQLAAAFVASEHEPPSLAFVSLDDRLTEAAHREGFRLIRL
jgi:predicted nucleic acid-binding protein